MTGKGDEIKMIAVVILIVLVTFLSLYSAFEVYRNKQDIKTLSNIIKVLENNTKGIRINAEHICEIIEILKQQKVGKWE